MKTKNRNSNNVAISAPYGKQKATPNCSGMALC